MKMSRNIGRNSSSASIRKGAAQKYDTHANKDEKVTTASINIEVLRAISRLVGNIRAKAESEGRPFK